MDELILIAASGLAREVAQTVEEARTHRIIGIIDDDPDLEGSEISGIPVLGTGDELDRHRDAEIVICAGRGASRRRIADRLVAQRVDPRRFTTIIHPSAQIPRSCSIGRGTVVLANAVMTADVRIGRHVVVMPNVTLTHDDAIGDFATLCAGVSLAGLVTIGDGAYIGANASVREYVQVGIDAVLGMGAVLLCDLPDGETWAGTPASALVRRPARLTLTASIEETS